MKIGTLSIAETSPLMVSDHYKDRFKAEYHQLRIRIRGLERLLTKWDNDALDFTPSCPRSIFELQLEYMKKYEAILEARATIENVNL